MGTRDRGDFRWPPGQQKQHSSGGKDKLGSISKQGDRYLHSLFTAGALAVIHGGTSPIQAQNSVQIRKPSDQRRWHQSGGQRRTDARDLIQPLARLARSVPGHDLAIEVENLCL
jgi:hypothetical protein